MTRASSLFVLLAAAVLFTGMAFADPDTQEATHDDAHAPAAHAEETHAPDDAADTHGDTQGEDAHAEDHGDGHGEGHDPYHLPNFISIFFGKQLEGDVHIGSLSGAKAAFLDPLFSLITCVLIIVLMSISTRRSHTAKPTRFQMAVEMLVGGLYGLFEGAIGPTARRYTPYLGTLFIFILINNFMGLVPFFHASTSSINTTVALALCTFLYVQFTGIKENGILGYLHHMAGSPRSGLEWGFVVLMFPLHVLGEFIKPLSLSLRLFGNVMGEDKLIAVFVVLGASMLAFVNSPIGIPIQVPIVFLALMTSTIQALVFTLLSTIYIALMLPHGEHEH
jgi:F-type H+-transporting ATPase subunit a